MDLSSADSPSFDVVSEEDVQSIGSGSIASSDVGPPEDEAKTAYAERPPNEGGASGAMRDSTPTSGARPRNKSIPPPRDRRIGAVLSGRYRLEKLIGKGGMGRVYLATQFPLNRAVAVKILNPEFQRKDPQFVRRFFLEAATAARLSHQNTITVFDYGETERKELYIAMEYLKGRPLSRALSTDGPFSAERALHVGKQIVRALREAHAKGIIHRDLKPGNIMLLEEGDDADYAKVLDFGLVKLFHPPGEEPSSGLDVLTPAPPDVGELTRAGMFLGSPKYMSPEQIQGTDLDPRTDIYSLGVIFYQTLTGRPPFRGSTSVEIIYKHVNQPVPPIHEINPEADCPPELEGLVMRCLAKNRDDRYASMSDLLVAIKEVSRIVIGVSSGTGGSISSDIMSLRMKQATDPSFGTLPPPGRPARPSNTPSAGGHPASEAAFNDPALVVESPSNATASHPDTGVASERPPLRKSSGLSRVAPYFAAAALVAVLGTLAYVMTAPPPKPIEPARVAEATPAVAPTPAPAPKPLEARISLHSKPEGAAVTEDGQLIGVTPFVHVVPRGPDARGRRTFVFTREGYLDEVVEEAIDSDSMKIRASLRARPKPAPVVKRPTRRPTRRPPPPPKPREDSDYKDNPY